MKKIILLNDHKISYHNSIFNEIFKINNNKFELHFLFYKRLDELKQNNLWELNENEFDKYFKEKFKINYAKGSNKLTKIYSIVSYILKVRPQYIFLQGYTDIINIFAILITKTVGGKILWRGEFYENNQKNYFLKKTYLKIFFQLCNIVFFSTTKSRNYIKIFYKGITYPMITSAPEFYKPVNYNYSNKKINIIFVGEVSERKNILLTAKTIVNSDYKNEINFIICGEGNLLKKLILMLKENRISYEYYENCKPDKLLYLYNISNFLILLSEYDPSPKVCNEAFNCHLPMFLSKNIGSVIDFEFNDDIILQTELNYEILKDNFDYFCKNHKRYKKNYKKINHNLLNTSENAKAFYKAIEIIN